MDQHPGGKPDPGRRPDPGARPKKKEPLDKKSVCSQRNAKKKPQSETHYQPSYGFNLNNPYCQFMDTTYKSQHNPQSYEQKYMQQKPKEDGHTTSDNKKIPVKETNDYFTFYNPYTSEEKKQFQDWLLSGKRQKNHETMLRHRFIDMISKELQKMDKKEEKTETDYIKEGQNQLLEIIKRKLDLHTEIEEDWKTRELLLLSKIMKDVEREERVKRQRQKIREEAEQKKLRLLEKKLVYYLQNMYPTLFKKEEPEQKPLRKNKPQVDKVPDPKLKKKSMTEDETEYTPSQIPRRSSLKKKSVTTDETEYTPSQVPRSSSLKKKSMTGEETEYTPRLVPGRSVLNLKKKSVTGEETEYTPIEVPRRSSLKKSVTSEETEYTPRLVPGRSVLNLKKNSVTGEETEHTPIEVPRRSSLKKKSMTNEETEYTPRLVPGRSVLNLKKNSVTGEETEYTPIEVPRRSSLKKKSMTSEETEYTPKLVPGRSVLNLNKKSVTGEETEYTPIEVPRRSVHLSESLTKKLEEKPTSCVPPDNYEEKCKPIYSYDAAKKPLTSCLKIRTGSADTGKNQVSTDCMSGKGSKKLSFNLEPVQRFITYQPSEVKQQDHDQEYPQGHIAHRPSYRNIFKQDSFKDNLLKDTKCQENLAIYESIDNTLREQKNSSSEEEIVLKDIVKELPKRHSEDMLKNITDTTVNTLGWKTHWFLKKSRNPTFNKSPIHSEIASVPWKGSQEEQVIRIVSPIETSSESSTNLANGGAVPQYVKVIKPVMPWLRNKKMSSSHKEENMPSIPRYNHVEPKLGQLKARDSHNPYSATTPSIKDGLSRPVINNDDKIEVIDLSDYENIMVNRNSSQKNTADTKRSTSHKGSEMSKLVSSAFSQNDSKK